CRRRCTAGTRRGNSVLHGARSVYEREVAQPLREVAQELAAVGVDLLREETEVVRVREDLLHRLAGLFDAAQPGQCLDQPERAGDDGAPLADGLAGAVGEPGRRGKSLADRAARRVEPLPLGVVHPQRAQDPGVERVLARPAAVRAELLGPAALLDPGVE